MRKVFAALAGKVRRMTAGMRERSDVQIDDYELEHFLLYNGLVGSSPENQPQYRDVRNDIVQALNDGSAHQMAIALKVAPLWWEDRLEKIFGEISKINRKGAIDCLLGERPADDITGDTTPLSHSNWQVRSNAARMLAFLGAQEAVPRLIEALPDCRTTHKAAYCHIVYSLGKLQTEEARKALSKEISQEEEWFRVDACGALSYWELEEVADVLMEALLDGSMLDDYMAVAIARKHEPVKIASLDGEQAAEGLSEFVISLIKALEGPFHSEHNLKEQLSELAEKINQAAFLKPSPRKLTAAVELNSWLSKQGIQNKIPKNAVQDLSNAEHYQTVKESLLEADFSSAKELRSFKHALKLAGRFRLTELSPQLVARLSEDSPALSELLDCLYALGDTAAAEPIAKLIESKVNLEQRCKLPLSAHPIVEEDRAGSEFYWKALRALGSLPHPASLEILDKAIGDHAADKREQALLSLQTILLSEDLETKHFAGNLQELIKERMEDPSVNVQSAALHGIAQHKLSALIPEVIKSLGSRETVIQRKANDTLLSLAASGHTDSIKSALESCMSKELDGNKKTRMARVLEQI